MSMDFDRFWLSVPLENASAVVLSICSLGGVVGAPYQWSMFARGHRLGKWCRWNLFWPRQLIPWHFPWFFKWYLWLHYLVGRLNFCLNGDVHQLGYRHGWERGVRHLHGFAIPCHFSCRRWLPWGGMWQNLVGITHPHRCFQFLWP